MVEIANPIFDIVFKYLMDDESIALTILSALLKKKVVSVEMRRNEYSNQTRDNLSNFRIDFGARVRETDGAEQLILIELQKNWLETEIMRFRQYVSVQYSNTENMGTGDDSHYAIPMVSVYLLGHRIQNLKEPVLYVHRKCFDYDGNEVTEGLPDRFIDSLTHDSIVVQIPRITGRRQNRLENVLGVFNQSLVGESRQILKIDEALYADDPELTRIIRRLQSAAANKEIRQNMTVEEEFFSAIDTRDAAIAARDATIAACHAKIADRDAQIADFHTTIADRDAKIFSQESMLTDSCRLLLKSGLTIDEIASTLKMDRQRLSDLLNE